MKDKIYGPGYNNYGRDKKITDEQPKTPETQYQIPEQGMPIPPTTFEGKYGFPMSDLSFETPMSFVCTLGAKSNMNQQEKRTLLEVIDMYLEGVLEVSNLQMIDKYLHLSKLSNDYKNSVALNKAVDAFLSINDGGYESIEQSFKCGAHFGQHWQSQHNYTESEVISMLESLKQKCAEEILFALGHNIFPVNHVLSISVNELLIKK